MAEKGLSSKDFTQRAAVATMERVARAGGMMDPLDQALSDQRKIQAVRLGAKMTADLEADDIKAENEKLKAEIEHKELEAAANKKPEQADAWITYVLEDLRATKEGLQAAQQANAEMQTQLLGDRLGMLQDELNRIRQGQQAVAAPPTALEHLQASSLK